MTSPLAGTASTPVAVQMSEVAKGKRREVGTPERTGNPPMPALQMSPVGQGKRKRLDNQEISEHEPVQRVRTFMT